jgi:solute carrier family 9 (sodium/hydrogen exchanger), member 8
MTTEPEKQQQWTGRVLFLCAVLELLLVHIAYRVDRAKRAPLISTASWAIGFGVALGGVLSYLSPDRASREGLDPQLLFFGFLPPIVLEAGFNTQRKGFFSNFLAICLLAVVGTLVATLATGALVYWMGTIGSLDVTALPLAEAMLYGALVSAIDPVATLVVLKKSRAPPLLFNLLFGESVLNDAIVIVVFGIVQHAVLDASGGEWWSVGVAATLLLQLVSISIGSVLLAAAICYSSAFCLRVRTHC